MENLSSEPIIKCTVAANGEVGSCTSYELSAGGTTEDNPIKYFVDGSTYPTIKSVIQCTFNDKCKLIDAVKSTSSASDHFYYIHGEDDGIIDCTGGSTPKCVAVAVGDADGYYIDGYDDKSIITCNSGCSSEKFVGIAANGDSRTGEVLFNVLEVVPVPIFHLYLIIMLLKVVVEIVVLKQKNLMQSVLLDIDYLVKKIRKHY